MDFHMTYLLMRRREQTFHTCQGLHDVLLQGAKPLGSELGQSEMPPGQRPSARCAEGKLRARSRTVNKSSHFPALGLQISLSAVVTPSGQNLTEWTDEIWQLQHNRQRARLAEGLGLSLGSYERGTPAVHV